MSDIADEAKNLQYDWALALMTKGVIVKLTTKRWRPVTSLTSEDLGLRFSTDESHEFMRRYVKLGKQKLLPPEIENELASIEVSARNLLAEYSFKTIWGRFVPNSVFNIWYGYNEEIKRDYISASIILGNRYDEIIEKIKSDYRLLAQDVWGRLHPDSSSKPNEVFISDFVGKIIGKIPPMEDIVSSFKFDISLFNIPMPSILERDIATAESIKMDHETKKFETQLDREVKSRVAQEYIIKKTEIIDGFLNSTVLELRKNMAELCDGVLISMGKTTKTKTDDITYPQLKKIKAMIKHVKHLNFANDIKVNDLLTGLDSEISKFKGERDSSIIKDKLTAIVKLGSEVIDTKDFNPSVDYLEL
jgi:hypothetical protein